MVKILFLKSGEVEKEINKTARIGQTFEMSVDEVESKDILNVIENKEVTNTLPIETIFPILEKVHNVKILSYDVYEVGDHGEGFAFSIA